MLYSLHDARNRALAPVRFWAEATRMTFVNPLFPLSWTPYGRMMVAAAGVIENFLAERDKPEWDIDETEFDGKTVPVSIETVHSKPFGDLVHFRKEAAGNSQPRILLVAPMSGHWATLLRDTVRALIKENDVWITDWQNAADVPTSAGKFGIEDYMQYLMDFLAFLHKGDDRPVHIMAVCQPAPLVLATVALLAEDKAPHCPASMTLMGGPVDTRAAETAVTRVAENRSLSWFRQNLIHRVPASNPGANRPVYPGFLQLRAFWSMNPARHAGAQWSMFKHLSEGDGESADRTKAFYDEYMSVIDVPADFFIETVEHVFKLHSLPKGTLTWYGRPVNPAAIEKVGLLTVEGELDDISAAAQTEAAHDICPNIPDAYRDHHLQENVGHYGIFNGRRWREIICPRISEFVRRVERLSKVSDADKNAA